MKDGIEGHFIDGVFVGKRIFSYISSRCLRHSLPGCISKYVKVVLEGNLQEPVAQGDSSWDRGC